MGRRNKVSGLSRAFDSASIYGVFDEELATLPSEPSLQDHHRVLALIARRAAARLAASDGKPFREEVRKLVVKADGLLSSMVRAEMDGDAHGRVKYGPQLSKTFTEIRRLAEDGLDGLETEMQFYGVVTDLLKRVEAYEGLKSGRLNALSQAAVGKMIDGFEDILVRYLPTEQARKAFGELMAMYPHGAEPLRDRRTAAKNVIPAKRGDVRVERLG